MDRISLLPPDIKTVRIAREKQGRLFFGFLIVLILLFAVNLFFIVTALFIRANLKALQEEKAVVEEDAAGLLEFEQLYQSLLRNRKLVNDAMGSAPPWGVLLRDISNTLPIGAQLTELRISYSDDSGTITMRGLTYDHNSLAALLNQLYSMEQLDETELRSSTEAAVGGRRVVQFLVDCNLLTGPVFLPDHEGGD